MPDRWSDVLRTLVAAVGRPGVGVVVEGPPALAGPFADRLADAVSASGTPCHRGSARARDAASVAEGPPRAGDVVIRVRAGRGDGDRDADIVVDLSDPDRPSIRHVSPALDRRRRWYVGETRAFFGVRAATWDARFGDDAAAYAVAVGEAGFGPGGVVLDVGCGTGRALPALRGAVGPTGTVVGVDLTPQMLDAARAGGRDTDAALVLGDARHLPIGDGAADGVFAAGLVMHLPDIPAGLAELARVTRPGGRLALFHPSGRAALAGRHGRTLRPDEPLAEGRLPALLAGAGWRLERYDDPAHRFLALAGRAAG